MHIYNQFVTIVKIELIKYIKNSTINVRKAKIFPLPIHLPTHGQ